MGGTGKAARPVQEISRDFVPPCAAAEFAAVTLPLGPDLHVSGTLGSLQAHYARVWWNHKAHDEFSNIFIEVLNFWAQEPAV